MTRRPRATRRPARGYVFLVVLLVMTVGMILVLAATERAAVSTNLVTARVREYQAHHEMLGVRDLIIDWAQKPGVREKLAENVRNGEGTFDAVLPDGTTITARFEDAQGAIPIAGNQGIDAQLVVALHDAATRLPPDRPDLVRVAGPPTISLYGAPEEVLKAVADRDSELLSILRAMQAEPMMDAARFTTALGATGRSARAVDLSRLFTYAPTLFRISARVITEKEVRRYTMLAEISGNLAPTFRDMRAIPGDGSEDLLLESERAPSAVRSESRRSASSDSTPSPRAK
ncbi:MAG: hypothetical protein J0L61_10145 [Planctomycetes bacterium]|nr:hypothetical protein [Planctomycetota bacterium]